MPQFIHSLLFHSFFLRRDLVPCPSIQRYLVQESRSYGDAESQATLDRNRGVDGKRIPTSQGRIL